MLARGSALGCHQSTPPPRTVPIAIPIPQANSTLLALSSAPRGQALVDAIKREGNASPPVDALPPVDPCVALPSPRWFLTWNYHAGLLPVASTVVIAADGRITLRQMDPAGHWQSSHGRVDLEQIRRLASLVNQQEPLLTGERRRVVYDPPTFALNINDGTRSKRYSVTATRDDRVAAWGAMEDAIAAVVRAAGLVTSGFED